MKDTRSVEDWIEFRDNATKYLEMHTQYATRKAVQDAINKQIPQKAILVHPISYTDFGDYMCPSCRTGSVLDSYGGRSNYCHYCGQKLDWGE